MRKNGSASVIIVNLRTTGNKLRVLYVTTNTFADGLLINRVN